MAEHVDTNGDPVPDVLLEAFFKTTNGNVVHIRVTGAQWELDGLLNRFRDLCQQYKYSHKGTSYDQ